MQTRPNPPNCNGSMRSFSPARVLQFVRYFDRSERACSRFATRKCSSANRISSRCRLSHAGTKFTPTMLSIFSITRNLSRSRYAPRAAYFISRMFISIALGNDRKKKEKHGTEKNNECCRAISFCIALRIGIAFNAFHVMRLRWRLTPCNVRHARRLLVSDKRAGAREKNRRICRCGAAEP